MALPPSAAMPRRSPTRSAEGIAIGVRPGEGETIFRVSLSMR